MGKLALACLIVCAAVSAIHAQNYRCDWNVVGIGGGEMSSTAYRCGSTAGQTAIGQMTGTNYQAFIGFWQIDVPVGIREEAQWPSGQVLATRLYAPMPNPCRGWAAIRYSLNAERRTTLRIHDLAGRVVRTLVNSQQKPGRYSLRWDGRDNAGRLLAAGVYFCKFRAGDYQATEKLSLMR
jgi:hypothetical protein